MSDAAESMSSAHTLDAASDPKCHGAATPELVDELTSRARETRPCYERALLADRKLFGRMVVQIRVEADGVVASARIVHDALNNAKLADCVVRFLSRNLMAHPTGDCVDVAIPLNFQPKHIADGGLDSAP